MLVTRLAQPGMCEAELVLRERGPGSRQGPLQTVRPRRIWPGPQDTRSPLIVLTVDHSADRQRLERTSIATRKPESCRGRTTPTTGRDST